MRTMLRLPVALPVGLLWLVAAVLAAPAAAADTPRGTFEAEKCGLCHGVAAVGISATAKSAKLHGPDLSGFVTDDVAQMIAYLRQEATPDEKRHSRKAKAPDDELIALLAWLESLDAPTADEGDGTSQDGGGEDGAER